MANNTASTELCAELYALTGWDENGQHYTLGFLLRQLPGTRVKLRNVVDGWWAQWGNDKGKARMVESHRSGILITKKNEYSFFAEVPEDAVCKLLIELIKEGVLDGGKG